MDQSGNLPEKRRFRNQRNLVVQSNPLPDYIVRKLLILALLLQLSPNSFVAV